MTVYFVRSCDLPRFETFADSLGTNDDVHLLADDAPLSSGGVDAVPVLLAAADTPSAGMQALVERNAIALIKADEDELASIRRRFGC